MRQLLEELKRRNVYKVAVAYAVVAFVVWQTASLLFPALRFPAWTTDFVIVLTLLGFPVALVLAWAFEMTPDGVRRTPGPDVDRAGAGGVRSWRRLPLAGVALVTLIAVGWGVWWFALGGETGEVEVSPSVVAVLPFSVRGSGELGYLGDGMVNLLTTKMDGAGDLRSVDPRALLSHLSRTGGDPLGPEDGRAVAERFGAGFFVLGDIVEVRGRLTISAALYDVGRGLPAVEEASAEGEAASISRLVDDLAAPLLATLGGGRGSEATQMAALTTSSLPALRAYLQGESALRQGDYRGALEAFRRAVERDTLFALGYYRLSIAAEWLGENDPMVEGSREALRHAHRLNERYRRLLTAFRAFRRGDNRRAEQLYRSVLTDYPDDVEGWMYLGENLFHTNPYRGETVAEAWEPFTRVMEYEPGNAGALVHMVRIAALEGRPGAVDSLVDRYEELNPEGDRLFSVRALAASVRDDEEAWRRAVTGLDGSSGQVLGLALWNTAIFARDVRRATELARLLTREHRPRDERTTGFQFLAMAQAARGRWKAADSTLTALEALDPLLALEARGYLYLLPHAPVTSSDLRRLRDGVAARDAEDVRVSDVSSVLFTAHDHLHPFIRAYLSGRLSARLGEARRARDRASELLGIPVPERSGTMAEDLARGIRAEVALQAGDTAAALEQIEGIRTDVVYNDALASFVVAEVHERFLRAQLLAAAGRHAEALPWFRNHGTTAIPEMAYLGPVHLALARSHERLGDRASAASHYRRFVELWSECDPELRPLVDEARDRLAALANGRG